MLLLAVVQQLLLLYCLLGSSNRPWCDVLQGPSSCKPVGYNCS
jgi:hypothetical protein